MLKLSRRHFNAGAAVAALLLAAPRAFAANAADVICSGVAAAYV